MIFGPCPECALGGRDVATYRADDSTTWCVNGHQLIGWCTNGSVVVLMELVDGRPIFASPILPRPDLFIRMQTCPVPESPRSVPESATVRRY